jgi:tRNA-dihydrouridine synthase
MQTGAKLDILINVVKLLLSSSIGFPIILNGDLYTRNAMVKMRRKPGADAVMFARPTLISASIFIKPPAENADCEGEETSRYGFDSKLLQRSFKTILFTQIPMTAMSIISSMLYAK